MGSSTAEQPEVGDGPGTTEESPLEAFWNFGLSKSDTARRIDEQHARADALVEQCMRDAGFEFQAVPKPVTDPDRVVSTAIPPLRDDGYGIVGNFADPNWVIDNFLEPIVQRPDVNAPYVASLSPAAQQQYFRTLFGEPPQLPGCQRVANEQAYGPSTPAVDLSAMVGQLDDLEARIQTDERSVAAWALWRSCIADAGFDYGQPMDIFEELRAQLDPILATADFGLS